MKLTCSKLKLYEAVINVSKAISERSSLPSLEGMKFKLEDSTLELTGYDLEIGIRTTIAVRSSDSGEFILNARLFSEMIKKMPADDIYMEVNDNFQVTLSSGAVVFNLSAQAADEYPELPDKKNCDKLSISQPMMKSMIKQTNFAVAIVDINPVLKGELFEIENNVFNLVAIDGYRLAVRTESIKSDENRSFIVPSKTLNETASLLSDNDEDSCDIFISNKHIIFEINGYLVYSRLIEGEFHPYKSAIPKTSTTEVIVDRRELISTLERVMLLISERTPSPVRCYFENGHIKIKCSTSIGKIQDEITADMAGPVIEIGFKCKYLLDPLTKIEDEKVKLMMGGSLLPMKIVPLDGSRYTYLVLPVRLSKEA
ncbi:MAG: DNA polymerase III subunit beta [Ruminococcus sp.]|nr:DNA polymerase III subunit beta [Ruminococcus sp.]